MGPGKMSNVVAGCPLCGEDSFMSSWYGPTRYHGKEFSYARCHGCASHYCRPMPDAQDLESMYGTGYQLGSGLHTVSDPAKAAWVLARLDQLPPATFMDYGCGSGELLVAAKQRGWDVVGVELRRDVADETSARTGLPVITVDEAIEKGRFAKVLHVGDVLEHLTNLDREMPRIIALIEGGGLLLAQGPLEANGNLFNWALRVSRSLRGRRPAQMAPYHVILATVAGQWALFRRCGLDAIEKSVTEVFWPAPAHVSSKDLLEPRKVCLHVLRLCSRALSRLRPDRWGNRYRYAGRVEGS